LLDKEAQSMDSSSSLTGHLKGNGWDWEEDEVQVLRLVEVERFDESKALHLLLLNLIHNLRNGVE